MTQPPSSFYPRAFATVTAAVLGLAVFWILRPFAGALLWAGLLAFLLFPLNQRLRGRLGGRKNVAALLLTFAVVLMVVVPTILLGVMFATQASALAGQLQAAAAQHQFQGPGGLSDLVDALARRIGGWLPVPVDQIRASLLTAGEQLAQWAVSLGGSLFASLFGLVVAIVIALFVLFFFLRDGELMVTRAMVLVPLDDRRMAHLLSHLADVTRAVVLGARVTALVQGTLAGIGFALAGVPWSIVFGVLTVGAAVVPVVGTALVWVPVAAWLGLSGHWGAALFVLIWGTAVVSSADHVVRPLFISSRAKISTLPVFIGLLGGIAAFGVTGIFLGPVVIALVLALIEFAEEARSEAHLSPEP
jgi:predicted PurR-regulated permease PerM